MRVGPAMTPTGPNPPKSMPDETTTTTPPPAAPTVFKTVLQLRGLAREECTRRGCPSLWTAGANRAELESFLAGGPVPGTPTSAPAPAPEPTPAGVAGWTPTPAPAVAAAPAPAGLADALAGMLASAAAGPVETLRAWAAEQISGLHRRVDSIPGGVAEAVAKIDSVAAKVAALGDLERLATLAAEVTAKAGARLPVLAAATRSPEGPLARLLPYYSPGQSNGGTVVCLCAPPSYGKSWAVRRLGESYDCFLEHPCTSDLDEGARLLGTVAPDGHGGFVTVDGALTEAVRRAAAGESVLLFLDEIFRLAERVAETLLTFLVPRGTDYVLRTRRPAEGGGWETLRCPVSQLHIVAAANLGPVPPLEAFWSRLHVMRLAWTPAAAAEIAAAILRAYGIDDPDGAAAGTWARAMGESRALFASGRLQAPLDFRVLERACRHAPDTSRGAVLRFARDVIPDQLTQWHPDTGDAMPASVEAAKQVARILA